MLPPRVCILKRAVVNSASAKFMVSWIIFKLLLQSSYILDSPCIPEGQAVTFSLAFKINYLIVSVVFILIVAVSSFTWRNNQCNRGTILMNQTNVCIAIAVKCVYWRDCILVIAKLFFMDAELQLVHAVTNVVMHPWLTKDNLIEQFFASVYFKIHRI